MAVQIIPRVELEAVSMAKDKKEGNCAFGEVFPANRIVQCVIFGDEATLILP